VTSAEKYATAAYAVVLAAVLLYVVIYAFKMSRLEREVAELAELAARREADGESEETDRKPEHVA
jgi:hypothetical protein